MPKLRKSRWEVNGKYVRKTEERESNRRKNYHE